MEVVGVGLGGMMKNDNEVDWGVGVSKGGDDGGGCVGGMEVGFGF